MIRPGIVCVLDNKDELRCAGQRLWPKPAAMWLRFRFFSAQNFCFGKDLRERGGEVFDFFSAKSITGVENESDFGDVHELSASDDFDG